MLIDLHAHSRSLSWDSDLDADELVERARAAGLDGLCLTEHDYFWDAAELRALGRRHDFLVLPGVEINTEDGHFLCFGIDRYVYGMHRSRELAAHVARAGGACIPPPPRPPPPPLPRGRREGGGEGARRPRRNRLPPPPLRRDGPAQRRRI